jgi:hypothetical protein
VNAVCDASETKVKSIIVALRLGVRLQILGLLIFSCVYIYVCVCVNIRQEDDNGITDTEEDCMSAETFVKVVRSHKIFFGKT